MLIKKGHILKLQMQLFSAFKDYRGEKLLCMMMYLNQIISRECHCKWFLVFVFIR